MITVHNSSTNDFAQIIMLTKLIYPGSAAWSPEQLASHLKVFPEGQFVAIDSETNTVVGYAASLIIPWDDYDMKMSWRDFTNNGFFTNHDPMHGKTLYGAEVMVHPQMQGSGIGSALYVARRELVERLELFRIRAGARLQGYHNYADKMSAEEYVFRVVQNEIEDPTLSFQMHQGFHVIAVVSDYLHHDPKSEGHAAVIEWVNEKAAKPDDYAGRDSWASQRR